MWIIDCLGAAVPILRSWTTEPKVGGGGGVGGISSIMFGSGGT